MRGIGEVMRTVVARSAAEAEDGGEGWLDLRVFGV